MFTNIMYVYTYILVHNYVHYHHCYMVSTVLTVPVVPTVQLKGNVTLVRDLQVCVESTYLSAILTDRNSQQILAP